MIKKILFDIDTALVTNNGGLRPEAQNIIKLFIQHMKIQPSVISSKSHYEICEQLGDDINLFERILSENGAVIHWKNVHFNSNFIDEYLSEENLQRLINFCLFYISKLDLPKKRSDFIDIKNGCINIMPAGTRKLKHNNIQEFIEYNNEHHILENFVKALEKEFDDLDLHFIIRETSIDIFPAEWDKERFNNDHTLFIENMSEQKTIQFLIDMINKKIN